jgi:phosphoglycolate phosphatase
MTTATASGSNTKLSSKSYDAVLLDLDGTMMDTIPDLAIAVNAMLTQLDFATMPQAEISTYIGKGSDNLMRRILATAQGGKPASEELFLRGRDIYYAEYHKINGDNAIIFDGVIPGLERIQSMGLKMAVVTNKNTEFTMPLLERTGLLRFMQGVVCGDTLPERKPHPAPMLHACALLGSQPARTCAVGDSINDALSARAAGCSVLAVPYGYNEGQSVHTLDVDAIVDSIDAAALWVAAR